MRDRIADFMEQARAHSAAGLPGVPFLVLTDAPPHQGDGWCLSCGDKTTVKP